MNGLCRLVPVDLRGRVCVLSGPSLHPEPWGPTPSLPSSPWTLLTLGGALGMGQGARLPLSPRAGPASTWGPGSGCAWTLGL